MYKLLRILRLLSRQLSSFVEKEAAQLFVLVPVSLASFAWLIAPDLSHNGLTATYDDAVTRIERVVIVTANDLQPDSEHTIQWMGYLYQPQASTVHFRIPSNVRMTLGLNDHVVAKSSAQNTDVELAANTLSGFHPINLEITTPIPRSYYQAGLEWKTAFGWRLVPAVYLYPEPIDPQQAAQNLQRYHLSVILWVLAAIAFFGWVGAFVVAYLSTTCRSRRRLLAILSLAVLALALRVCFLHDYASSSGADILALGSDHLGYQRSAVDLLRGLWPPRAPFYVQPGISLFLGIVYSVVGVNIRFVQVIQMVGGALTTMLVYDITRRVSKTQEPQQHKSLGLGPEWIAAVLWAIFPLPIFYEAHVLTHGIEPQLGALIVWLWIITLDTNKWQHVALLGLILGISAVVRPTFLIFAPIIALSIAWKKRFKPGLAYVAILTLFTCLPITPITWHNYTASGQFQLLNSSSSITFYLGNNRASGGLGEYSPDFYVTQKSVEQGDTTYMAQSIADIQSNPGRWIELMLRKMALYLSDGELPNNVDFYREGTDISPLLSALPLRFGAMMALGLAGLWVSSIWKLNKMPRCIVIVYILTHIMVTVTYHVVSRFRAPIYSILPVMGAWSIWWFIDAATEKRWRDTLIGVTAIGISGMMISAMPWFAGAVMSRPVVISLPLSATPLDIPFGESITLIGYESSPSAKPGQTVFVTLYWQLEKPLSEDLSATVQLLLDGYRVAQNDQTMGTSGFPDYPTSTWKVNEIVWDRYYIPIPDDVSVPISPSLFVAAYHKESLQRVAETSLGLVAITHTQSAVTDRDVVQIDAQVGTATLVAYKMSYEPKTLALTLYWQATEPVLQDGIVFIHIKDANGKFIVGQDQRPCNGSYWTQAWQKGEIISDKHSVALPANLPEGKYFVTVGMYDSQNQVRFGVAVNGIAMKDNILPLGEFTLAY